MSGFVEVRQVDIEESLEKDPKTHVGLEVVQREELHDSEYNFHSEGDEDEVVVTKNAIARAEPTNTHDEISREVNDEEEEKYSDCISSKDLQSCSSIDEDEIDPNKPRYTEFNEEIDVKDPQFKVRMKSRSFTQFKEVVRI